MDELETQPEGLETQVKDTPEPEPAQETAEEAAHEPSQTISIEEWMAASQSEVEEAPKPAALEDVQLLAVLEACVYVVEEPLMPAQIAAALNQDPERIRGLMQQLMAEFERPEHGVSIKEVAGGYKMATKPEHHEAVRNFVKSLKAPLKLSLPALETLAVVAYKQPVTSPEIMEIRGVQGGGVLKTLLDRKLITEAGRKNVIGKPILYKTTKEFLIQFGLKDLSELPTLKEFEEIRRMAFADGDAPEAEAVASAETLQTVTPAVSEVSEPQGAVADDDAAHAKAPTTDAQMPVSEAAGAIAHGEAAQTDSQATESGAPVSEAEAVQADALASRSDMTGPLPEAAAIESEAPVSEAEAANPEGAAADAEAPQAEAPATEPEVSTPESVVHAKHPQEPPEPEPQTEAAAPAATAPEVPAHPHPPAESLEK